MKDFTDVERKVLVEQFIHAAELLSEMPDMGMSIETREIPGGRTMCALCVWDERTRRGRGAMIDFDTEKAQKTKLIMALD